MSARFEHSLQLAVEIAPRAKPGKAAVVLDRRPRVDRNEHDHPDHDQAYQQRRRAERELGAAVGPGLAQTRQWACYLREIHCVEMIFCAAAAFSIQPMNAEAAPVALPFVTS